MPLIQYIGRRFKPGSLAIIEQANVIIAEYAKQGLALTLRQLYYRFIAADAFSNTEQSYKRLGSIINDGRLAGLIDWNAIEDRGRELEGPNHWDDPAELIDIAARSFRIDKWSDQPKRVEVWVEKQALITIIGRAAHELDCSYFACKGYTSQSAMWRAARRFERYVANDQEIVVIHLGDHDPSGIDMTRDILDRLNDVFQVDVEIQRIALNMDQIREYDPPPNPAKLSDSRAPDYIAQYGSSSWELDALEPATLHSLIQDTIRTHMDVSLWDAKVEEEEEHRDVMRRVAQDWEEIEEQYRD